MNEDKNPTPLKAFDLVTRVPSRESFLEYSSIFSSHPDKMPNYLLPYKDFVNNIADAVCGEPLKAINEVYID